MKNKTNAWVITLQDKLKMEHQLEDRIKALEQLEKAVIEKNLAPPFDVLPGRGKLNVKNFLEELKKFPEALNAAVSKSSTELKPVKSSTSEVDDIKRPASRGGPPNRLIEDQKQIVAKKNDIKTIETNIKNIALAFPSNKVSNCDINSFYLI